LHWLARCVKDGGMIRRISDLQKTRMRREGAPLNGGLHASQAEKAKIGARWLSALQTT
jgi:hypothetical protein